MPDKMTLTERTVQRMFWHFHAGSCEFCCPNFTPVGWYECDIFAITKAGLFHELEIKLTVADFKADAKKHDRSPYRWTNGHYTKCDISQSKHERLASHDVEGPSRFYFVVPEGLIEAKDVPEWAGLRFLEQTTGGEWYDGLHTVKKAPLLHKQKVGQPVRDKLTQSLYYRFWNERIRTHHREKADG